MSRKQDRSRWTGILGHDAEITGHVGPKYAVMPQGSGHSVPMTFEELLAHHAAITAQAEHDRQALQIALLTIDKLKTEIAYLKRMRYGRSSERLEHDTQMLLMDEAHAPSSPVQSHVDESLGNVVDLQRERHKRQAKDASLATAGDLPTHLPRRTVVHPPQPLSLIHI